MTGIEEETTEHEGHELLSRAKGEGVIHNEDIKEMAMGIALEFFDYPGTDKDDLLAKRDLIALGIKLLLKRSKIPCEEKGLFVVTREK